MAKDGEIVLTGAAKRFGAHTALHRTNLAIARGQAVLLAGTNGAGKSTMLRMIAGLCQPSEGEVLIGGRSLLHTPAARATIGFLSHHTLLYDELTARENLHFFAQLYGLDNVQDRLDIAMAEARLEQRQNHRVSSFSRGMKQRLALARATLHAPLILLLDEPFTGLDTSSSAALLRRLHQFRPGGGIIILVTHRLDEADGLVDRLLLLERGHLRLDQALSGDLDELHAYCAPYLDAAR